MPNDTVTLQTVVLVVLSLLVVSFVLFVSSGGILHYAIEKAIEENRVILGMTKDQVSASWGSSCDVEDRRVKTLGVDELVSTVWTYHNPERTVHFDSEGHVIWVDSGD